MSPSKEVKAKITDIKVNKEKGFAIVGVEITTGTRKYHKAFQVKSTQKVTFDDFKLKLVDMVKADIEKEKNSIDNMKELEKHKGIQFKLKLDTKTTKGVNK